MPRHLWISNLHQLTRRAREIISCRASQLHIWTDGKIVATNDRRSLSARMAIFDYTPKGIDLQFLQQSSFSPIQRHGKGFGRSSLAVRKTQSCCRSQYKPGFTREISVSRERKQKDEKKHNNRKKLSDG